MSGIRPILLLVVCAAWLFSSTEVRAQIPAEKESQRQSLRSKIRRQERSEEEVEPAMPFINFFHPDWPVRGKPFGRGPMTPYSRTPKPSYSDSPAFRGWFRFTRNNPFSRRRRWPYTRTYAN